MINTKYGIFSDGTKMFVSNPNPKLNEEITIKVRFFTKAKFDNVYFVTLKNGEERYYTMNYEKSQNKFDYYMIKHKIIHPITEYHFVFTKNNNVRFYNQRGLEQHFVLKQWEFTILANNQIPEWIHDAVFYQIFPDRYYNGDETNDVYDGEYEYRGYKTKKRKWNENPLLYKEGRCLDFFGGDLDGIIQKIETISSSELLSIANEMLCEENMNSLFMIK